MAGSGPLVVVGSFHLSATLYSSGSTVFQTHSCHIGGAVAVFYKPKYNKAAVCMTGRELEKDRGH